MASSGSSTPSLTPSRSATPDPPFQPDHFYGADTSQSPRSPSSDGRTWLDPSDDPLAQRGIPVFKPNMEEFQDFEGFMNKIECWGMRSGIVKVIPPKEWRDALPGVKPMLTNVKLKNPIEQQMMGRAGLFRQQNIEKRKVMSVREWAELCGREELRAPGVDDIGLHARATNGTTRRQARRGRRKTRESETAEPEMTPGVMVKEEEEEGHVGVGIGPVVGEDDAAVEQRLVLPPDTASRTPIPVNSDGEAKLETYEDEHPQSPPVTCVNPAALHTPPIEEAPDEGEEKEEKLKQKCRRHNKEAREAASAERAAKDEAFLEKFDPHVDWLPPKTKAEDYTPEFCKELERRYWRNCGLGRPAWYGADMQGSLFTDETTAWNVAHLPSALSRLLPSSSKGLPGVNTPYLYFGMWRATFAWHVEDMDLFSINYIHFGAPKFWYAVPQARATALEQTMKGHFPKDISNCRQFLRHKSYLASPSVLSQSSVRANFLVQHEGEFVITYPRGYHAGYNLGFNCAESVNFALESWIELGRVAKACECVDFSVHIDVDQLLRDREAERLEAEAQGEVDDSRIPKAKSPRKRKANTVEGAPKPKKIRVKPPKSETPQTPPTPTTASMLSPSRPFPTKVTLKLGPQPKEPDVFPCCLCVSTNREGLLRVENPPLWRKEGESGEASGVTIWMAHEECANVVPETWIDDIEVGPVRPDGMRLKERVVLGVDGIVKDRWNLKCNACTKTRHKSHGAPIQCTKGRCPKAFHVSCARDGAVQSIIYNVVREVHKEVVLLDPTASAPVAGPSTASAPMDVDHNGAANSSVPQILKFIKKVEVELLCPQHNPAIAEAKKAAKQDKIRSELVALPAGTRIKLRVSAGVFEVTLCRVVEESKSVEVLWDRGLKREFKWGSVVFGSTELVVGQKPSEAAPELEHTVNLASMSRTTTPGGFSPVQATTPTFAVRPPGASYPRTSYGYTPGGTTYAPPPPPPYTQYQSTYYAGYTPPTTQYQARAAPPQYNSSWSSYHYYGQPSSPRYTVGTVYTTPSATSSTPNATSSRPLASSSQMESISRLEAAEPVSQSPTADSQSSLASGERPAYTTMTYQGYSSMHPHGYTSCPPPTSTAIPAPVPPASVAPLASATTPQSTQPSKPYSTAPTFSAATGSAFTVSNLQQPQPYVAPLESSVPTAGTSLRWQRPYTGPKFSTDATPPSHASPPQPQPQVTLLHP